MASSGSFYQLPDELYLKIFSYLSVRDLVLNIQYVDSHWKAIVQDISFWRDYVFTLDKQMQDKEIILLLQNMPALRALVATRATTNKVIQTLCNTSKFITRLELHLNQRFTAFHLETIVKNLLHIQHLAFPLFGKGSENAMKYSTLIQQFHELLSLRLLGYEFNTENCFFLKGIATECPLLHEIDLGGHLFLIEDVILFLKAKKEIISKFSAQSRNSVEIIRVLESCKQLQTLCFAYVRETLINIPLFDILNLKHLAITHYFKDFSIILKNLPKSTMSNLVKLDLSFCYLDPMQFEKMLINCMHLKILILKNCGILNGGDLKHIRNYTHLEYLDVNNTMMTDFVVEIFAEKFGKKKYLDISESPWISNFSLLCLIMCRELQTLKLTGHK